MITNNKLYNELINKYLLLKRRSKKQSHNYTKFPWFIKMKEKFASADEQYIYNMKRPRKINRRGSRFRMQIFLFL